ncbi:MAG: DEAD/DEAH box helicase [Marinilabiliaceae bacterium]|nr:DEAD/DEAH box helicase [Marinilabiliaceae bacterium]
MSSFDSLGLSEELLAAVREKGFEDPTPVQERTIPEILNHGRDIISLAQTGTGKTAAFGLPIVQLTDDLTSQTQALILSPTRELCLQIAKDIKSFASTRQRVQIVAVYGGSDIRSQIKQLKGPAHIVVGTPGRVIDLIDRGVLKIGNIRWLVLDEADEMLNMGFKDDIETILSSTPEERQTLLFSATMPPFIEKVVGQYMKDPMEIRIGKTNEGAANVEHQYYIVKAQDRYLALKRIVDMVPDIYGIVFCRTRQETKEIADKLIEDGYNADALHGDLSQAQRDMVMQRFRTKHLQLLVATDVAARGIDVMELTHVINYNLPDDAEVYVHRSGRTGRAGKSGISVSIIHTRELNRIRLIEKISHKKFIRCLVPSAEEICQKKLLHFIDGVINQDVDSDSTVSAFLPTIMESLSMLSKEEIVAKFIANEFETVNRYYQNAADLNVELAEDRKGKKEKGEKSGSDNAYLEKHDIARLFINIGKIDHIKATDIIGLINDYNRKLPQKVNIGHIDLNRNFSFVEVDRKWANEIINNMNGKVIDGYKLVVEMTEERARNRRSKENDSRKEYKNNKREYNSNPRKERGDKNRHRSKDNERPFSNKNNKGKKSNKK